MTCIASDGRSIAADGRMMIGDRTISDRYDKLIPVPDGSIIGVTGATDDLERVRMWAAGEAKDGDPPKLSKESALLRLYPDGSIAYAEFAFLWVPMDAPAAIGSGAQLAEGAMLAGKSPAEAVKIAAKRMTTVGGKVRELRPGQPS